MTRISISLDEWSIRQLDQITQKTKRSRSEVVRDMVAWYELKATTDTMRQKAAPLLKQLGLETDEQISDYASQG